MTDRHKRPWTASFYTDAVAFTLEMSPEQEEGSGRKSHARQVALREGLSPGLVGRDAGKQQMWF